MNENLTALSAWGNFYVIVGSSAGALIGLQFVVLTLIAEMPVVRDVQRASSAFASPTVVHFGSVLLLSAILSAPWRGIVGPVIVWGALGVAGLIYIIVAVRRVRVQTAYSPVFEDWLFYIVLPFGGYATLAGAAYVGRSNIDAALFAVGSAAVLLLFIGIHNAWDAVTYHVFSSKRRLDSQDSDSGGHDSRFAG
jgi:hypothetical protein